MENKSWTIGAVLDWTSEYFGRNAIPDARLEAELLLSHVLNCKRLDLNIRRDEILGEKKLALYRGFITERKSRKPLAYIIGEQEFMGIAFRVNESTLIPRPETEILVEKTLSLSSKKGKDIYLELGTGSANISVSIAKNADVRAIFATDISIDALKVAQENISRHGVASKITLKHGNMFSAVENDGLENAVDFIVSNPPYIAKNELAALEPELKFEPVSALDGGDDGLDFYRSLASGSKRYLKRGGCVIVELNAGKSMDIRDLFETNGFETESLVKDYSGLDRVLTVKYGG